VEENMKYKAVPHEDDRYIIVDEGEFGLSKKVTSNLESNEHMITFLEAENCPIDKLCVKVIPKDVSSICNYLGVYPILSDDNTLDLNSISCKKDEKLHRRKSLEKNGNCKAINAEIPRRSRPLKSNAYVICE
jgi:hypothetical protein